MMTQKIIIFGIIGLVSTGIHLASSLIYISFLVPLVTVANIMGYLTAAPFAYVAHSKLTFKKPLSFSTFASFLTVNSVIFLLSVCISIFFDLIQLDKIIGTVISVSVFPVISYFANSRITFR